MTPSTSYLARFPKKLNEQWEQRLEPFETMLAENLTVQPNAVTIVASLDGVMPPMKDGKRQEKREKSVADGKRTRGPAGCQKASCGKLSFYDDQGDRLSTISMGRMPESKKATFKKSLSNLLDKALQQKPDLTLFKVADGAKDNWTYFRKNRLRMNYAEHLSRNLPIGSGVIEASCKTLVTQQMKCSGMRWQRPGGQGILHSGH